MASDSSGSRRNDAIGVSLWLAAAGYYNLLWGAINIAFPHLLFDLTGTPRLNHPEIWQCVGMIVGVYGVGYLIAAGDTRRHWPIVLVGLLGKVLGPVGFAWSLRNETFPLAFGATIITNDLIWWIPFVWLLRDAAKFHGHSLFQWTPRLHFVQESQINVKPEDLFAFHESPGALASLIPPWENMRPVEHAESLAPGSRVVLRGRVGPVPVKWVAVHREYDRPRMFADEQESGPFVRWFHRHYCLPDGHGGSILRDEIEYALPGGLLGVLIAGWYVRRTISRMFAFRHETTKRLLESGIQPTQS